MLRGGQARAYIIAEEHEDGSLLLAPEPVASAQRTLPAEDGRAAAVAVPEVAGILQVRDLTVNYGPKRAVDAVSLEIRRGEDLRSSRTERSGEDEHAERHRRAGPAPVRDDPARRHRRSAIPTRRGPEWACSFRRPAFSPSLRSAEIVRLYAGLYGVELSGQQIPPRPARDRARGRGNTSRSSSSPADSNNASPFTSRSSTTPRYCCSTSPPPASIRNPAASCGAGSSTSARKAEGSRRRRTRWRRPRRSAIGSRSSITARY